VFPFLIREQRFAQRRDLAEGAAADVAGFLVLAKILFADKKHSDAEPVPRDVLVVTLARADLLAILIRIAG
jgi:hypothetical protein